MVTARSGERKSVKTQKFSETSFTSCSFAHASVSTIRYSVRPFGESGLRRIVLSDQPPPPATVGARWRKPSTRSVRAHREREDGAGHVEIVDRHREAALRLVAAPRLGDRVELGAQHLVRLLRGHDPQRVPGLRHPRDGLADLADRAAVERELGRAEHRLLPDRDRAQAEPPVAVEMLLGRAEDGEAPAVRLCDAPELGEQRVELLLVADRVGADERGAGDDAVREERPPRRREEVALVAAEGEEREAVAAVRVHERASDAALADGLPRRLRDRAEPEEERREPDEEAERGERVGGAVRQARRRAARSRR